MRLQFGECIFDTERRVLERNGSDVPLSGKAFRLLEVLLEARPNPLKKEELFERVWPDTYVAEANLASLVKEIRAAIGDDAREPRFIRTVHRFGYAFAAPVTELRHEEKPIDSIAVLPFSGLGEESEVAYLQDGLAESLVNALSSVGSIRVAPRSSSFRLRDHESDFALLRKQLNVRALLTGRLRVVGGDVVLQVELTDLVKESQLWGSQFRRPMRDLLALQEELAREVAAHLHVRLTGESEKRLTRRYTSDSETYQLYLKGRHHWNRRTLEGIERGIFYFQSAIDIDPKFPLAWSGLADSYIALASRDLFPPTQLFPKAEAAATRALELDADLAEAHASIGAINEVFKWNWEASERAFAEALRLNPNYVTARMWYAQALAHQGRFSEALAQLGEAREHEPLSFMLNTQTAVALYLARDWDGAERRCNTALEINPHHEPAHFALGLVHQQRPNLDAARSELLRAHSISKGEPHVEAALGALDGAAGDTAAANARLQRIEELSATRHVSPVHRSVILTAIGDQDAALRSLEQAVELRSGWLVFVKTEPRFDPLRREDRFKAIVKTIGLGGD